MKRFAKNNQSFTCEHCGTHVEPHPNSSRDHCTNCLYSKHVDNNPGDRANECHGLMKPIGIEIKKRVARIVYKCETCGQNHICTVAPDDNREEIIKLSAKAY